MRRPQLVNDEIYHIFNRGIEKKATFTDKREYKRAHLTLDFYRFKNPALRLSKVLDLEASLREEFFSHLKKEGTKLVEILSYCLMPNHFHLLVKQLQEQGIKIFLSNFSNSYTRYFNTKHKRIGSLFQGIFKAVRIEDNEQLIHVSRYIHLNPIVSFIVKKENLANYDWSSLPEYLGKKEEGICAKELILSSFSSIKKYQDFVYDQIDYAKKSDYYFHFKRTFNTISRKGGLSVKSCFP